MSKKKYELGRPVESMADLVRLLDHGEKFFYIGSRISNPKHSGFITSMTFRTISGYINRGRMWTAHKIDKE
jgi:hypothetical protein